MDWHDFITFELSKRSAQRCIRGLQIAVSNVTGYLDASLMFIDEAAVAL